MAEINLDNLKSNQKDFENDQKNPFDVLKKKKGIKKSLVFNHIQIKIASSEDILNWSSGEVKKAETINYRTHRAEPDGLMCEKIFGPTKDWECFCGKYKKYKHRGIICDKCGVEVTTKSVRRERMGHIRLACPVAHIWYSNGIGSKISTILDIPFKKMQSVIYFSRYLVVSVDKETIKASLKKVENNIKSKLDAVDNDTNLKILEVENQLNEDKAKLLSSQSETEVSLEINNLEHKSRIKIARLKESALKEKNVIEAENEFLINLLKRIQIGETLTEEEKYLLVENEVDESVELKMGAEAIQHLLANLDLIELEKELKEGATSTNLQKRLKSLQRLRLISSFIKNKMQPDWMVLEVLPVIAPELRPIVQISGGRFATADLNDLYRRVINRNNRLKRLMELGAPEVIMRNEKRMLQEAVDALLDNDSRGNAAVKNKRNIPLKSLSSALRGKHGRFRQNLLGKRVDYSGRAVIVSSGKDLKLDQCGIPKDMALELFKPFVIQKLIEHGIAVNARSAKLLIEGRDKVPDVWNILEEVITDHPVLLNRAPTLHKHGIQAFYPVLIDGEAISLHPLVCGGFNADFDGDTMAIHVPLTEEAIKEAKNKMTPDKILLNNASGEFMMTPSQDIILGLYYITTFNSEDITQNVLFTSFDEVIKAYDNEKIDLKDKVRVYINGEIIETSAGRIIFNKLLPDTYKFVNKPIDKKALKFLTLDIFNNYERSEIVDTLNKMNKVGFQVATESGYSLGIDDLVSIPDLDKIIAEGVEKTSEVNNYYKMGFLTEAEKTNQIQSIWTKEYVPRIENLTKDFLPEGNNMKLVADSGARYKYDTINQIVGIKGLVFDSTLKVIELPLTSNYTKGFTAFEYFVSARGGRKGLVDTALRTADSGYLTRKLCEVSQDFLVREEDCGSKSGLLVSRADDSIRSFSFSERLFGRVPVKDIKNKNGEILVKAGEYIEKKIADIIAESEIDDVEIRTPLSCKTKFGVCKKCYGYDHGTNKEIEIGKAVGIIAAQSIGEPVSQLVLRTFHKGGTASADITVGMPRVQELFEARIPKGQAVISDISGSVNVTQTDKENIVEISSVQTEVIEYPYTDKDKVIVKQKQTKVKAGDLLLITSKGLEVRANESGTLTIKPDMILIETSVIDKVEYKIALDQELQVTQGDEIEAGTKITDGNIDPKQLLYAKGLINAQKYIIDEIQRTYELQGIGIGDKHLEVITAQMGRYLKVVNSGDSELIVGEYKDKYIAEEINRRLKAEGKKPAKFVNTLLGITAATLKTESFLSAASFQEQVRVLGEAAILGKKDYLRGLKENIIIGRKIPTGKDAILGELEV